MTPQGRPLPGYTLCHAAELTNTFHECLTFSRTGTAEDSCTECKQSCQGGAQVWNAVRVPAVLVSRLRDAT